MAAVAAMVLTACGALTLIEGVGPILAVVLLGISAVLFGNWYRNSTIPVMFESEPSVADPEIFAGFSLHWTEEGAASHAAVVPQVHAGTAR
jgi:hypothetical protein